MSISEQPATAEVTIKASALTVSLMLTGCDCCLSYHCSYNTADIYSMFKWWRRR